RSVLPGDSYEGWTITIHDRGADGQGVSVTFDMATGRMDIYVEGGFTTAADVQAAVYATANAPFLAYAHYRGSTALPFADYADGPGSQLGQRVLGGAGADYLYAWAPSDAEIQTQ